MAESSLAESRMPLRLAAYVAAMSVVFPSTLAISAGRAVYQRVAKQIWSELSNDLEPAGCAQSRASATTHLVGMVEWSRAQGDDTVTLSASAAAYEAELFMRVAEECFAARAQMHQPEPEPEPEPEAKPKSSWFAWLW